MYDLVKYANRHLSDFKIVHACFGVYKFLKEDFEITVFEPYFGNGFMFELLLRENEVETYRQTFEVLDELLEILTIKLKEKYITENA